MGIQAFQYNKNIFGVQFHPEFTDKIMESYVLYRKKNGISIKYPERVNIKNTESIFRNFVNYERWI